MVKIEEVKKILECESDLCLDPPSVGADDCGNESHSYACIECQTKQICQLFEPQPDQSRLLEEGEFSEVPYTYSTKPLYYTVKPYLKAQDAKTASMKDAQIERLTKHYNTLIELQAKDIEAECDKRCADEKAESGLSVNEAAVALCEANMKALIEFTEWLRDMQLVPQYTWNKYCAKGWDKLKATHCKEKEGC